MYVEIKDGLEEKGYPEDTASRIAEIINDWGWEDVRDVLNEL